MKAGGIKTGKELITGEEILGKCWDIVASATIVYKDINNVKGTKSLDVFT